MTLYLFDFCMYEWFAAYLFAYRKNLLEKKTLRDFAEQMGKNEWFAHIAERRQCSCDAMGDYNYLITTPENDWEKESSRPQGSKASDGGIRRILRIYNNLCSEYKAEDIT